MERREIDVWMGFDWADQRHQVSMRVRGSEEIERFAVEQSPGAIEELVSWLKGRFGNCRIAVALEQKKGALIYSLMKYSLFILYPLNTTLVKNYRKTLRASGAKDDPSDADLQLMFLEKHFERVRAWEPESCELRALRMEVESRRKLVDEATALSNQIRALLKEYYPVACSMVGDITTMMACDFLMRWSNFSLLKKAKADDLRKFYQQHNCRSHRLIEERLRLISTALPLVEESVMIEVYDSLLGARVKQLKALIESISDMEKRIEKIFTKHPDAELFKSFPGAGSALAPRLLVGFGEDRNKFESAAAVLNLTGVAPISIESGKFKRVAFRFAAPKFQRQTFIEYARVSVRSSVWAKADYDNFRAHGMSHQAAIRRIAYKWIRIIFRCWKDRVPYEEAKYMQARFAREHLKQAV